MTDRTRRTVEEVLNAATHGVGAIASLIGGVILVSLAVSFGNPWHIAGAIIYSVSLVLLYTASALYHWAERHHLKERLRVFDHCAIYVLIAGSYTPFALGPLRGIWGWGLLAAVWTIAILGITHRCFVAQSSRASAAGYLAMAWICLIAAGPALQMLGTATLLWLLAGGIAYTAGTFFYSRDRIPFAHPIWHCFVLAGSVFHFAAVFGELV